MAADAKPPDLQRLRIVVVVGVEALGRPAALTSGGAEELAVSQGVAYGGLSLVGGGVFLSPPSGSLSPDCNALRLHRPPAVVGSDAFPNFWVKPSGLNARFPAFFAVRLHAGIELIWQLVLRALRAEHRKTS